MAEWRLSRPAGRPAPGAGGRGGRGRAGDVRAGRRSRRRRRQREDAESRHRGAGHRRGAAAVAAHEVVAIAALLAALAGAVLITLANRETAMPGVEGSAAGTPHADPSPA